MKRRTFLVYATCALSLPTARADEFPTKAIRILVPFAPGGATDTLARAVSQKLAEMLRQPVIVENRAGASGNIGTELVAKSPPDGYTLLMTINTHVVNPLLYSNIRYDAFKDFQPLTLVATAPNVLVSRPGFPAKTVQELIALAKTKPDQITFGSAGPGSGSHLAGVLFNSMAGVKLTHVPYKGVALAMNDVMGGQVDLSFVVLSLGQSLISAGKVQGLAVTGAARSPLVPELPTIAESGLPGFDVSSWFGLLLPANTPRIVFDKLQTATVQILQSAELRKSFAAQGLDLVGNSPQEFAEFMQADSALWSKIIKANNIRLD